MEPPLGPHHISMIDMNRNESQLVLILTFIPQNGYNCSVRNIVDRRRGPRPKVGHALMLMISIRYIYMLFSSAAFVVEEYILSTTV